MFPNTWDTYGLFCSLAFKHKDTVPMITIMARLIATEIARRTANATTVPLPTSAAPITPSVEGVAVLGVYVIVDVVPKNDWLHMTLCEVVQVTSVHITCMYSC